MYERIYTIGCFDHFHYGHIKLLSKMREYGKILVVGIHDDASIEKLKKLHPEDHQPIEVRIKNVKEYADVVYVIPSTDPTLYIDAVIRDDDNKDTACYIRADDMPNFPSRDLVENKISLKFLPYTEGISSTKIREENKKSK